MGRRSLSHRRRRIVVLSLVGASVLGLVFTSVASANFFVPDAGGSPNANDIQSLYEIVLVIALVIFVGVEGALFYALFKFRARKGAVAAQIHGNTRLEVGWTLGAAVILVVLAVITFTRLGSIRNPPPSKAATGTLVADSVRRVPSSGPYLNVCVNGQQYVWRFTYETGCSSKVQPNFKSPFSYEQMVVPQGVTVTLDIVSQDVAHSWWIPQLGGKFDAIPGYTNHTWFQTPISKDGKAEVYNGQCAELCGRNHADMIAQVLALPYGQWKAWLALQAKSIKAADAAAEKQRAALAKGQSAGQNNAGSGVLTTPAKAPRPGKSTKPAKPAHPVLTASEMLGKTTFLGSGGCSGCHTLADAGANGTVGPDLDMFLPMHGDNSTAFIMTSITDPNAFIEKGYSPNIMPANFAHSLTKAQLAGLVAYLHAVAGKK